MINIFFPIINKFDYWISSILSFAFRNLFWGLIAGSLAFIIYAILSNQSVIANIKIDIKSVRQKMFDPALENKSDYNLLAKKNLTLSFRLLGKILLPATLSIIPVVIIAIWYDMNHSYYIPFAEEKVVISSNPSNLDFNINPPEIASENLNGSTFLYPQSKSDSVSIYIDGKLIFSGQPFSHPIPIITKRSWWNLILGSPIGYVNENTHIETLVINYPQKVLFDKLPKIINGWELLFFVGIFISAITLRIIFKIQ